VISILISSRYGDISDIVRVDDTCVSFSSIDAALLCYPADHNVHRLRTSSSRVDYQVGDVPANIFKVLILS